MCTELTETVSFGIDGKSYELVLPTSIAEQFRETLKPYIDRSRHLDRSSITAGASSRVRQLHTHPEFG